MRPIPDEFLRKQAAERRPLIEQWPEAIPSGYIASDDAVLYLRQRFGKALTTQKLEAFESGQSGPRPLKVGKLVCYAFDEVDLWAYRMLTGVPADWREVRDRLSLVPVRMVENLRDALKLPLLDGTPVNTIRSDPDGEEPSDGRSGIEEDGWDRRKTGDA
jgi:hypothetical protein